MKISRKETDYGGALNAKGISKQSVSLMNLIPMKIHNETTIIKQIYERIRTSCSIRPFVAMSLFQEAKCKQRN